MKRINLTHSMAIKERLEIIASRIEKNKQDIAYSEVKSTMDVLKYAGITARWDKLVKKLNKRLE